MRNIILLFCFIVPGIILGQVQRNGVVKDQLTGEVLIGVTVAVKGTTEGTFTDVEGKFSVKTLDSSELEFSYIGYKTVSKKISIETDLQIFMDPESHGLGEVVITALGIKKERQALGYAVQDFDGKSLEKVKESNAISSLTGKVAGLTIKNSGDLFQNPDVSLRGAKPLIVIDGIPDRTADIWRVNSDDIENISILKGATASALYGSVGRGGAIMITTKKGKEGRKVNCFC